MTASNEWGRVDTDGTVYVRTADGERAVGSWHAGSPEDGLAHFARRYDDLATEVGLLESRLGLRSRRPEVDPGPRDRPAGLARRGRGRGRPAPRSRSGWPRWSPRPRPSWSRPARPGPRPGRRRPRPRRSWSWRPRSCPRARSGRPPATGSGRSSRSGRRSAGVDRKADEQLWKRFAAARDTFTRRRGSHFAALDEQRGVARARKEQLVAEAESLSGSTDWGPTAEPAQGPDDRVEERRPGLEGGRGAAVDPVPGRAGHVLRRSRGDVQRARRRAAGQPARQGGAHRRGRGAGPGRRPRRARRRGCARSRSGTTRSGTCPRDAIRTLDNRMRAAEQRVREAGDAEWRRGKVDSNPLLDQLRDTVAKAEAQLAKAQAGGDASQDRRGRGGGGGPAGVAGRGRALRPPLSAGADGPAGVVRPGRPARPGDALPPAALTAADERHLRRHHRHRGHVGVQRQARPCSGPPGPRRRRPSAAPAGCCRRPARSRSRTRRPARSPRCRCRSARRRCRTAARPALSTWSAR